MKTFYLAVAVSVLCASTLGGYAVADPAGQGQTTTSVPFEPQDYSPPLGGDSCSTPTPTS